MDWVGATAHDIHDAHLRWGATRARAPGARAMRKRLGPSGDLVSYLFGKFRLPIKEAPLRQLSASGAASVSQREQGHSPARYAPPAPYAREQPLATADEQTIQWQLQWL